MMGRPMLRRISLPLALAALFLVPMFGPAALCSCGGPASPEPVPTDPGAPAPAAAAEPSVAPAPVSEPLPAAAEPAALPDFSDPSFTRTTSATGRFVVAWRPTPAPIPRNEEFTLEVWLLFDDKPRHVTQLAVSGWMPDHGHGMLRTARAEPQADGSYRIADMLLHMRGHWLVIFDVLEGNLSERAEHSLELR